MLQSILFPTISKPISLKNTILGIIKINICFFCYCFIITAIALLFRNPNDNMTPLYDTPIVAWAKIPSLLFIIWNIWITYKFLKTRLQTNGWRFPIITIYLFIGSLYFITHPNNLIDFIVAALLFYYTGSKFIK